MTIIIMSCTILNFTYLISFSFLFNTRQLSNKRVQVFFYPHFPDEEMRHERVLSHFPKVIKFLQIGTVNLEPPEPYCLQYKIYFYNEDEGDPNMYRFKYAAPQSEVCQLTQLVHIAENIPKAIQFWKLAEKNTYPDPEEIHASHL